MKVKKTFNSFVIMIIMMIFFPLIVVGGNTFENNKFGDLSEKISTNKANLVLDMTQQRVQISGIVVDKDGFPLPGVAVSVKERKGVGVATDMDGKYTIEVSPSETLIWTCKLN